MNTQRSKRYRKHRRSKYAFPTVIEKGGGCRVGADRALRDIEARVGRRLEVVKTGHSRSQWVFLERRPEALGDLVRKTIADSTEVLEELADV